MLKSRFASEISGFHRYAVEKGLRSSGIFLSVLPFGMFSRNVDDQLSTYAALYPRRLRPWIRVFCNNSVSNWLQRREYIIRTGKCFLFHHFDIFHKRERELLSYLCQNFWFESVSYVLCTRYSSCSITRWHISTVETCCHVAILRSTAMYLSNQECFTTRTLKYKQQLRCIQSTQKLCKAQACELISIFFSFIWVGKI